MKIFSGIQPTGELHIGNYLGAVKQWIDLQKDHECIFCVVDLHALTVPQDPATLRQATLEKAAEYMACGLDTSRCTIFVQSHVSAHSELAWIFNTITPIAELERMTQYKDKAQKQKENVSSGLFTYPILMAADILLYQTDAVPVGEDQTQHVELARMIARKFNSRFGEVFKEPEVQLRKQGARIMSLKDPEKKMSKSDGPSSFISLFEDADSIKKKIAAAVTDTDNTIAYDYEKKAGVSNLLTIYALLSDISIEDAEKEFIGKGYAQLKEKVAEKTIETLAPFREKKLQLMQNPSQIQEILEKGAATATEQSEDTMKMVREKIGLLTF